MNITIDDIKVTVKLLKSEKTLARATVTFCDSIETHGWRISASELTHPIFQEPIWIQPPMIRAGTYWTKIVWTKDKKLWNQIEEEIYNKYRLIKIKQEDKEIEEEAKRLTI